VTLFILFFTFLFLERVVKPGLTWWNYNPCLINRAQPFLKNKLPNQLLRGGDR
jgi:hypothetical protein